MIAFAVQTVYHIPGQFRYWNLKSVQTCYWPVRLDSGLILPNVSPAGSTGCRANPAKRVAGRFDWMPGQSCQTCRRPVRLDFGLSQTADRFRSAVSSAHTLLRAGNTVFLTDSGKPMSHEPERCHPACTELHHQCQETRTFPSSHSKLPRTQPRLPQIPCARNQER